MIDKKLLDILACPKCRGDIELNENKIICNKCNMAYPIENDIPIMLLDRACLIENSNKSPYLKKDVRIKEDCFEFFSIPYDEILKPAQQLLSLKQGENPLRRYIFSKYNPKTKEDLFEMYKSDEYLARDMLNVCDNYFSSMHNLTEHEKNISYIYKIAFDLFSNRKDIPILDYGAGTAIYALKLYFQGFSNITIADIPHKYLKFLEFLCKKYGINIKFIYLEDDESLKEKYQYIICSEVLEHVFEPEEVLDHLKEHLDDDGTMYLSTFFDDMHGEDPTHLVKNTIRYNSPDKWLAIVKEHGIEPVIFDMNNVPKGFRKIKDRYAV